MKSRPGLLNFFPSPLIAVTVGIFCVAYVQLSDSATLPTPVDTSSGSPPSSSSTSASTTTTTTTATKPSRISTLRSTKAKPQRPRSRLEAQAGKMKASDIKACISKAFCEVNSASRQPNYAVNQEFFDIMNQIQLLSDDERIDSGSTSVEYDDDDESSEESSYERPRGYPPPPRAPPRSYRMGKKLKDGVSNSTSSTTTTENSSDITTTFEPPTTTLKSKTKHDKTKKLGKKKMKVKTVKKYVNGTFISVPKRRRSRIETAEEKAERNAYLTRKQREMGQVNDLAALIRISADIGLTLRSPRKCRTLFNKCTMTHEQIVDLFNQTLLAVTTPANDIVPVSSAPSKTKVSTSSPVPAVTKENVKSTTASRPTTTATATTTTLSPSTTTDDQNRSSKRRHDFSDEDIEYITDTEIKPVQTYALFVNDAPEDSVRTAEEMNIHETFKQYANTFPGQTGLQENAPALKKSKKDAKKKKRAQINRRNAGSSEEDEDEEDEEEDDDPASMSTEDEKKVIPGYPTRYTGYRQNPKDEEAESAEPSSAPKESSEGILPPLVQKQKPVKADDDDDDEEEDDEESEESVEEAAKAKLAKKPVSKKQKAPAGLVVAAEESSEEDEVELANNDEQQSPPPWTPVYQMYMHEKKKQGHKKKQKGPYKGGEGPYSDSPLHGSSSPQSPGGKKPWGSQEYPAPSSHSHESIYADDPYHGNHPGQYGNAPPSSQEGTSEQKQGFLQSIMSWFTGGNKNNDPNQQPDPYGSGQASQYPFQSQPQSDSPSYASPSQFAYHQQPAAGASWPSQPDPAGVSHYPGAYSHHQAPPHNGPVRYRATDSSEEDEEDDVEEDETRYGNKRKNKRRYRGRSDSIITAGMKKKKTSKSGSSAAVVILPKKSTHKTGKSPAGVFEPKNNYETLIQTDGGITSALNSKKKGKAKENIRTKKAAVKPKQQQTTPKPPPKQTEKPAQNSASFEDDDEIFSSEEQYAKQKQVEKLTSQNAGATANANKKQEGSQKDGSFPSYFESMFGNENKKNVHSKTQKEKDDGSLLFGFETLSSQLHATPHDLPIAVAKKPGGYKVTKNKVKSRISTPIAFNAKEVPDSPEDKEEEVRKK